MPISDAREIIADNAALVAEKEALTAALAEERQQTEALMQRMERYIAAAESERSMYERKLAAERKRNVITVIGAVVIGVAIGVVCK